MRILDANSNLLQVVNHDFGCEYTLNFQMLGTVSASTNTQLVNAFDVYSNSNRNGRFTLDPNLATA